MAQFTCSLLCFLLLSTFLASEAAPESALVTHLPGFNGTFPSKHYAGYVTVDESHGKNLFYYLVVSERNPSKAPVVLWLNGGPGCSSFDGFVYEHGPFNFQLGAASDALPQLHLNPYSWSKVSNIIYLDSPSGVGLSYSKNKDDYITGDLKTASDSHTFLLKWFQQYPEFLANPFFISGESYAGVYVPTLAYEVATGIEGGLEPILNFKGYMVGNGVTDTVFDGNALVPFARGMGLISEDIFEEVNSACQGKYWNTTDNSCKSKLGKVDKVGGCLLCASVRKLPFLHILNSSEFAFIHVINDLNIYNILEPCYHSPKPRSVKTGKSRLPSSFRQLGETERPLPVRKRMFGRSWPLRAPVLDGRVPTWPELGSNSVPCFDDGVATSWLNNASVRTAIHAQMENVVGSWELCTGKISYEHDAGSMIKYHKNLTAKGYRALIFSGDHDMCVPFTGSEAWTRSMGYGIIDEWRPWFFNEQVVGYLQAYANNLTFLTIKGAGHTVPEYKPREALAFYSRWLIGESI